MRYAGLGLIVVGDFFVGASSLVSTFDGGEVWKGDLLFLCASLTWSVRVITALAAVPLLVEPLTPTVIMGRVCVTAGIVLGLSAARPMHAVAEPFQGNERPLPSFLDPLAGPEAKRQIVRRP